MDGWSTHPPNKCQDRIQKFSFVEDKFYSPIPPVTNTGISANSAAIMVPATVVAPSSLAAIMGARSRRDAFTTPLA